MAGPSKQRAIGRLVEAREALSGLESLDFDAPEVRKWARDTEVAIQYVFSGSARHIRDFTSIWRITIYAGTRNEYQRIHTRRVVNAYPVLDSMIKEIEDQWEDAPLSLEQVEGQPPQKAVGNRVFVIHGRNHGVRDTVVRFLEKLQLEPVVMMEQPNQGRTVIEKLEDTANADFAVALLTPDDQGMLKGNGPKARGRQNVIFELGYFLRHLGRDKVCALVQGEVEIPSDYYGVLYIALDDSGAWQQELMRELKAAGFTIDANLVL